MHVPYSELRAGVKRARAQYPDASDIKPIWKPNGEVPCLAEVWHGNRAQVVRP